MNELYTYCLTLPIWAPSGFWAVVQRRVHPAPILLSLLLSNTASRRQQQEKGDKRRKMREELQKDTFIKTFLRTLNSLKLPGTILHVGSSKLLSDEIFNCSVCSRPNPGLGWCNFTWNHIFSINTLLWQILNKHTISQISVLIFLFCLFSVFWGGQD